MGQSIVKEKSFTFALQTIRVYQQLQSEKEFVLSKQLLRSGTSIGANVEEALAAQSRRDFLSKMSIASKEARETRYWFRLVQTSRLSRADLAEPLASVEELIRILTSIVKTTAQDALPTQNSKLKTQN
jgi:four helix bundle protein